MMKNSKLFEAVKLLREYCDSTNCKKCDLKAKIHCDTESAPAPYAWGEYNNELEE